MFTRRNSVRVPVALALTSVLLLASPASGQTSDLESDVAALKADNAAVREQLRRMEEQQKALLELVDRLQRRLDGTEVVPEAAATTVPGTTQVGEATAPSTAAAAAEISVPAELSAWILDRYEDGIVLGQTPDDAPVPFLLRFNNNTQVRYLNTTSSNDTFTDHLGVVRDVHLRNDITVNRSMFILGGYIFDKRLRFSNTVWTSAGAASIIVAGNIGWQFNKGLAITGGYTGVPGSRSLVNTFPFFTSTDRSMADNFFRPGFTQGLWAHGETPEGAELPGVRRERAQHAEHLGQQDRHESTVFGQCLVGAAGRLRGARQVTQHVR
jgi:hypothetical protein